MPVRLFFTLLTVLPLFPLGALAQTQISLTPSRDTVLFEDAFAELSSGRGAHLFSGRLLTGERRRSLIAFNFSSIPTGATILGARLTLYMSMTLSGPVTVSLHRAEGSWGEAASDSGFGGGGANAQIGDATWAYRNFDQDLWQTEGGDFQLQASAQTLVLGLVGFYDWSGINMLRDVQRWIDNPTENDGWILIGAENSGNQTAMRFESRENFNASRVPTLAISYQLAPAGMPAPAAVPTMGGPATWLLLIVTLLMGCRRCLRQQVPLQK